MLYFIICILLSHFIRWIKWKQSNRNGKLLTNCNQVLGLKQRERELLNTKQMKKNCALLHIKCIEVNHFTSFQCTKQEKTGERWTKKKKELQYVAHENAIWFYLIQFVYPLYQLCICPFSNTIKWNWWKSEMFKSFSLFAIANQSKEWIDCFYLSFTILSLQFHYHEGWQYKVDSMKIATFQLTANLLNVLL